MTEQEPRYFDRHPRPGRAARQEREQREREQREREEIQKAEDPPEQP
jgi:hypothetical protein